MFKRNPGCAVAGLAVWWSAAFAQTATDPLGRLDFSDREGHLLFFVNFEYDAAGNSISRSIYDPEGFILARDSVVVHAGREAGNQYRSIVGDLQNASAYSFIGDQKTVKLFNEFGILQYESSYSMAINDQYIFKEGYRFAYEYDGASRMSKIKVYDKAGQVTHVVTPLYPAAIGESARAGAAKVTVFRRLAPGKVEIAFHLDKETTVRADLSDLGGRRMRSLENRHFGPGKHRLIFDLTSDGTCASGTYVLRFSLGTGSQALKMKVDKCTS